MTIRASRWSQQRLASSGGQAHLTALQPGLPTLQIMVNSDVPLSRDSLYSLLQTASKQRDLHAAHRLHSLIISSGFELDAFLSDHLIRLFTLCAKLPHSRQVFQKISTANVYSWNALIQAHTRLGEAGHALKLYELMGQVGCVPDKCTFCCVLKACGCLLDLSSGMLIHDQICEFGMESDLLVGSTLVDMYGKCGSLDSACTLFDKLPNPDMVSWCALICALAQHSDGLLAALEYYRRMRHQGVEPNQVVFLSLLKACIITGALWLGMMVHDTIIRVGYGTDKMIANTLIDMYSKCGSVDEAYKIFCGTCKDSVTWGAMIDGYVQHGYASRAFDLFMETCEMGIELSEAIALCALKACNSLGMVKAGMLTSFCIISNGLEADKAVGSALIDMYAKCGCIEEAKNVFELMEAQDIAAWGTLIAGYVQCGLDYEAFDLFRTFNKRNLSPDSGILLSIVKACTSIGNLELGRFIHGQVIKLGFFSEEFFGSSLVNMYAKLGNFNDAHTIFNDMENPDVASWGALIGEYAHHGHSVLALEWYFKMQTRGMKPDYVVYVCALKACGSIGALREGRLIHSQMLEGGLELKVAIGDSLINMYSKCGSLDEASKVLTELPSQSVVSWAPLIEGWVQHGKECLALELFAEMQKKGIIADLTIYLIVARACVRAQNFAYGRLLYDQVIRSRLDEQDVELTNVLVDMYAKWGHLDEALKVFQTIRIPDVVSWGTLIAGYALNGDQRGVMLCLKNMQIQGLTPDSIIFTSIISACRRSGLLEEGCLYFSTMEGSYGITPHMEHHNSMIDILARLGHLKEAEDMLQTMSSAPGIIGQTSLIMSCRTYSNMDLGARCFDPSSQSHSIVCNMGLATRPSDIFTELAKSATQVASHVP